MFQDQSSDIVSDEEDVDVENYNYPCKQVIVGICAMEKKAQSKPMKEILKRLEDYFEYIKTLVFEESVILNKPIEEWPICDCLISFHSKGFPLSKAIEYARLRKPFLVNDLDIQYDIQDRRKVYKILEEAEIELPRYVVLDRDSHNPEERELIESDDHIEIGNCIFNKPFVEKPISAEDHNICIYYPAHAGGGSQRLFRKIGCRSSVYSNESHVRKTGSYIYEEFMPTDGTDVKVYTAGPDYAHAEARKSPALDGKVERDSDGKEIRYPVILTNNEKLIARRVCLAFQQTVCGFDLLRANGHSYVCDVNGFSFVKSSMKYYEDCSKILGNMMLRALAPQLHIPWSIPFQLDDPPIVPTTFGRMMELRCVIAVIRHGDRTPKQKMKLEVKHQKFFELYQKYGNTKNGQAKLKKPKQLQEVLDIARYLLGELPDQPLTGEVMEPRVKLRQLKSVLEMYGHFSGINRKVQLKYQPHGRPRRSSSEDDASREPSLVLILKWGGELTPAGRVQAEDLGRCFRRLYPASGDYSGPQGLGLLRLHSTFRHDLKIYASDEGRVQMTAAAFAKGFLALEGELTPILFQMVKSANTNGLLDNDCESSKCQKIVKVRLHDLMQKNHDLTQEDLELLNPTRAPSIEAACKFIGNPYQACDKVHKLIKELNALIKTKRQDNSYTQEYHLYHGETWDLLQRRWAKLEKDFKFPRTKRFDISKVPDIYDCIKYDLQHNQHTLQFQHAHELHTYAKALADIVIPQEYGMTAQEKLMIGLGTCSPLLRKIQADLLRNADSSNDDETESVNRLDPKYSHGVSSPDRHVRTRLYFTSESHIHSLVTALQYGGLLDVTKDEQWKRSMEFLSAISELNYLSQVVIMLYEDPTKEPTSDDRFHVEIHFSSGVINRINHTNQNMPTEPQGPGFRPHLHNKSHSNASSTCSSVKGSGGNGEISKSDGNSFDQSTTPTPLDRSTGSGMIKEEATDDERSTDGESRANSKSSSVCLTPNKKISSINSLLKMPLDSNKENVATSGHNNKEPDVDESSGGVGGVIANNDNKGNNRVLTQPKVRELSAKAQQRCLARSYSAITPISLQDLSIGDGSGDTDTDGGNSIATPTFSSESANTFTATSPAATTTLTIASNINDVVMNPSVDSSRHLTVSGDQPLISKHQSELAPSTGPTSQIESGDNEVAAQVAARGAVAVSMEDNKCKSGTTGMCITQDKPREQKENNDGSAGDVESQMTSQVAPIAAATTLLAAASSAITTEAEAQDSMVTVEPVGELKSNKSTTSGFVSSGGVIKSGDGEQIVPTESQPIVAATSASAAAAANVPNSDLADNPQYDVAPNGHPSSNSGVQFNQSGEATGLGSDSKMTMTFVSSASMTQTTSEKPIASICGGGDEVSSLAARDCSRDQPIGGGIGGGEMVAAGGDASAEIETGANNGQNQETTRHHLVTSTSAAQILNQIETASQPRQPQLLQQPVKNNWKNYEQHLASELAQTPQLQHHTHHRPSRRRQQQQQQFGDNLSLSHLPPSYHTINHWNFTPTRNQLVGGQRTSVSISTSPQQFGATGNLQSRYMSYKQQQQQQQQQQQAAAVATARVLGNYDGLSAHHQFKQHPFTLSASIPIQGKSRSNPRACSVADVSQYCGGPSSLISTAVISGSSPELVAVCPYSPNIRPLETLHNELSLKQYVDFINRLTHNHQRTCSTANIMMDQSSASGSVEKLPTTIATNSTSPLSPSSNSTTSTSKGQQEQQVPTSLTCAAATGTTTTTMTATVSNEDN